jgi:CheY-like chemotaxis protein
MTRPWRLLMVEDSVDDADLLLLAVHGGGYEAFHERVETPATMREALERQDWDLITCDHAMPQFSAPAALVLAKARRPEVRS